MQWIALALGIVCGGANYALMAIGCKQITGSNKRGALFLLGGFLFPVAGLIICALVSPSLLLWFGCACAGALPLLALLHMAYLLLKKR